MAANVESMFCVREKPWHGLGTMVAEAPGSSEALRLAGLDWNVVQKDIMTADGGPAIPGFRANVRDTDGSVLGIVTDRYRVVQNTEAFSFTDALLGGGVRYETAGSLQGGRRIWVLARLPHQYIINGEEITPYLVFMNAHDGNGAIKVAMTPVRVVCQNTLNLALSTARRSWSFNHTGDVDSKLDEARDTLLYAGQYMAELGRSFGKLAQIRLSDGKVAELIGALMPDADAGTPQQRRNIRRMQEDMRVRYYDAPDLADVGRNGYRFINAVSDFATHSKPLREHAGYREALFARTVDGNPLIDRAYQMVMAAA